MELYSPMNPESQLAVAISSPDDDMTAVERALRECLRWEVAIELAERHSVAGRLASAVRGRELSTELPEAIRQKLENIRDAAVHRDRLQALVLGDLADGLRAAGIPFMHLKGIGLAERLYGEPSERSAADIDILVRKKDVQAACEVLVRLDLAPLHPAYFQINHFHVPFARRATPATQIVELHWDVTLPGSQVRFSMEDWWNRARSARLRSGEILIPPQDEEFVYLAYHAFSRGTVTLRDLGDIARLWSICGCGEDAIEESARRSGTEAFVNRACWLARRLWNAGPDGEIAREAGRQRTRWISRNLLAPETVLATGARRWWPYRRICYWSLLPRTGAVGLVRYSLEEWAGPGSPAREGFAAMRKVRRLAALVLALSFCCLPLRFFPPSPRPL